MIPLLGYYIENHDTYKTEYSEDKVEKAYHFAHRLKFEGVKVLSEAQIALQKMLAISEYDTQMHEIISEVMESQTDFGTGEKEEINLLNGMVQAMGIDFTKRVERKQTAQNNFTKAPTRKIGK